MRLVDVVAVEGVVFVTLFFSIISFIVSFFQNTGDIAHCVARLWARIVLIITGVKVRVHGLEHIDEKETYVFMSNHQSMYDIPALLGHLRVQFRWLAKIELFRIPVFGRAMSNAGYIEIDRANRKAAFRSIKRAARKVREGTSVLVFPEGSRSDDGRIKPFKKGGFVLALSSGRPIVPITILGSGAILPKGSLRIEPGRILLRIHPPVETTGFSNKNIDALMETVRSIMCRDLKIEKDANG